MKYGGPEDLELLNSIFVPKLNQHTQVSSMMVVTDEGFEYLLMRDARGSDQYEWFNRIVWADRGPLHGLEKRWTKDMKIFDSGPLQEKASGYDPRAQPFYTMPGLDSIHWTKPYYFFGLENAGITAVLKWKNVESGQIRLLAFDLMLAELSHFTSELRPTENGSVFVVDSHGSLMGLPADPRWPTTADINVILQRPQKQSESSVEADIPARLLSAKHLDLIPVHNAIEHWKQTGEKANDFFRFRSQNAVWYNEMRPFDLGGLQLWIGVIVPEDDLLADATRTRNLVLLISFIAIIISIIAAYRLSTKYSKPLRFLADQSESVRQLNLTDKGSIQSGIREIDQLSYAQTQMMTALDSFSKYVPLDLVRELLHRGEVAKIGGRNEQLTILFTDVENFTNISESLSPEKLTHLMAEYFKALLEVLHEKNATVDKFIGDSIMAFWGAPVEDPDHARNALEAALACNELLQDLNMQWKSRGLPVLHTRFGISTGVAMVGNVGAPERLNYTVLGDTVNTASRVEALNRYYGTEILATESTKELTGDQYVWRFIDAVRVKGKNVAIKVFEPLGLEGKVDGATITISTQYQEALDLYFDRQFEAARETVENLLKKIPDDGPSVVLLEKCINFIKSPPGEDWDGISHFENK